jgi:hypothetical protein
MKASIFAAIAGVVLCQYAAPLSLVAPSAPEAPQQQPTVTSPWTFVTPLEGGGYAISHPGNVPYRPPNYIRPLGNGGFVTNQPGIGVVVVPNAQENR